MLLGSLEREEVERETPKERRTVSLGEKGIRKNDFGYRRKDKKQ